MPLHFHVMPRMPGAPAGHLARTIQLEWRKILRRLGMERSSDEEVARVGAELREAFVSPEPPRQR